MASLPYPRSHQTIFPTEFTEHRNDRWRISSHRLRKTSDARYSPTDCTDFHRLGGYGIPAIPTQPSNYLPTEFTEHTETTGGEEKSVYICEIRGRLFSARSFCVFCEFCGRTCASKLCGRNLEGGVGMAGMPYPPTSVKICAICGRFLFKGAYLLCWCSRDCCTP